MISNTSNVIFATYFHCKQNGSEISLMPIDHARAFPLSFDINSRKIVHGQINFYNEPFYKNFKSDNFIETDKCKLNLSVKCSDDLVIYNVLDNCFGHAFLKLLLAIENSAKVNKDKLVIIPSSLIHFVKEGVFTHALVLNYTYKELESCYILNKAIEPCLSMGYNISLYPIHTYGIFDRKALLAGLNIPEQKPDHAKRRICFYYRSDQPRMWAGKKQASKIVQLFTNIRVFFDSSIIFTVIGSKDSYSFPDWIEDRRVSCFSKENDVAEHLVLNDSLIVIAVTGSHMLMPSLLSSITVHLHPVYKYKNMAEDVINFDDQNGIIKSYKNLFYYGNKDCSDIDPGKLAYMILLHFQGFVEKTYKQQLKVNDAQTNWIKEKHPYFINNDLNKLRIKVNNEVSLTRKFLLKLKGFLS